MDNSLKIQGLCKRYRKSESAALDEVNLNIAGGSIYGLIGPNGAGKSTLVRCLLGLEQADAGKIIVAGMDLAQDLQAIRLLCGLAPQDPGYYPRLTVAENLQIFGRAWGLKSRALSTAVDEAMAATHLQEHGKKRAEHLSGGQRQRMNLSMALLNAPKILILDEPTAGVDAQSRRFMLEMLKNQRDQGTTIIYTSHYLTEIEQLCDKVGLINRGQLVFEGSLQELRAMHPARLHLRLKQAIPLELQAELGKHVQQQADSSWLIHTDTPLLSLATLQQQGIAAETIHYGPESLESIYFTMIEAQERRVQA
ncbi:MAG: ABC transporter ATP-binding protein [Oceanococcus sp.]